MLTTGLNCGPKAFKDQVRIAGIVEGESQQGQLGYQLTFALPNLKAIGRAGLGCDIELANDF